MKRQVFFLTAFLFASIAYGFILKKPREIIESLKYADEEGKDFILDKPLADFLSLEGNCVNPLTYHELIKGYSESGVSLTPEQFVNSVMVDLKGQLDQNPQKTWLASDIYFNLLVLTGRFGHFRPPYFDRLLDSIISKPNSDIKEGVKTLLRDTFNQKYSHTFEWWDNAKKGHVFIPCNVL